MNDGQPRAICQTSTVLRSQILRKRQICASPVSRPGIYSDILRPIWAGCHPATREAAKPFAVTATPVTACRTYLGRSSVEPTGTESDTGRGSASSRHACRRRRRRAAELGHGARHPATRSGAGLSSRAGGIGSSRRPLANGAGNLGWHGMRSREMGRLARERQYREMVDSAPLTHCVGEPPHRDGAGACLSGRVPLADLAGAGKAFTCPGV